MVNYLLLIVIVVIAQRVIELYVAKRNYAWLVAAGAQEFGQKHYPLFFLLHMGWLISFIYEGIFYGMVSEFWYWWLLLFICAQGLRYWCITTLRRHWNTRILVIPGTLVIRSGPYRFLRHPNYIAVAIELFSIPMIFGAVSTAAVFSLLNAWLILGIRIPAEERALSLLK